MIGELENWRLVRRVVAAVWVRRIGVKAKRVVIGVARRKALVEVVVRVRRGVDGVVGRWMSVRRARRAKGEIN
jgi:hypothetical protein